MSLFTIASQIFKRAARLIKYAKIRYCDKLRQRQQRVAGRRRVSLSKINMVISRNDAKVRDGEEVRAYD